LAVLNNRSLSLPALEQMLSAQLPNGSAHRLRPQIVRVGLQRGPEIAAPLGWVLSRTTRDALCGQLRMLREVPGSGSAKGEPTVGDLERALRGAADFKPRPPSACLLSRP
jgi:hypothetical protein